jgi:ethanolamine utilization protein EutK
METINSLGLLEVRGLVTGIEAADAMLKSAQVRLLRQHQVSPGLITLVVEGDLAACRASVDAGIAAASRVGEVISQRVIGAPDEDTGVFVLGLAGRSDLPFASGGSAAKAPQPETVEVSKEVPPALPALADIVDFLSRSARGFTWREIGERFADLPPAIHDELDQAVKDGKLGRVFGRYKILPPGNGPAPSGKKKKGKKK